MFPAVYVHSRKELEGRKVYDGDVDEVVCKSKNVQRVHERAGQSAGACTRACWADM